MQFTDTLAELNSSAATFLAEYWERKRGPRRMPARTDIDPVELKPILPIVILVQIESQPFRVFYRLICRERRPVHGFGSIKLKDGSAHNYASAVFPLSSDGETVDHCIAVEDLDLNLLERDRVPRSRAKTDD